MSARFFAPAFRVRVNGSGVEGDVSALVLGLSVTLEPGVPARCDLTLANPLPEMRWTHSDDWRLFQEGNALEVAMGYADDLRPVFDGEVTGMTPSFPESGGPTLQVQAHDRLHRLQVVRRERTLTRGRYELLVKQIAGAAGLTPAVDDTGPEHPYLVQSGRTDYDFLRALAKVIGFELFVEGKTLHFRPPASTAAPALAFAWGSAAAAGPVPGLPGVAVYPLRSFSPTLDARQQVSEVIVRGQDPLSREGFEGRATARDVPSAGREPAADVAYRAFGVKNELYVGDEPVATQAEAKQRARAIFAEKAMQLVRGSGSTLGVPELRPGTTVHLEGLGPRFGGRYYVTRVNHRFDGGGFSTGFDVRKDSLG
jgi:phage protein D